MRIIAIAGLLVLGLGGCVKTTNISQRTDLPYDRWYIGLAAPRHMEVWVESVDIIDRRGYEFFRVAAGVAGYTRKTEGWHKGGGSVNPIINADLPLNIFLRWQSLAEQKTYMINVQVPEWVRNEMVKPKETYCQGSRKWKKEYESAITLGMAPGGVVKVWLGGACQGYREVGRYQAVFDPRGPYNGKGSGKYIPIEPENKAYIDAHGIPYGTW